jgi:hypothetical protein
MSLPARPVYELYNKYMLKRVVLSRSNGLNKSHLGLNGSNMPTHLLNESSGLCLGLRVQLV